MPDPNEVATLIVEGRRFDNWETVFVQHRWTESHPLFRFTTADIVEMPPDWTQLQFKPRDFCRVYLGPWLAINGVITVRQTGYGPEQKGVQFDGVGLTWAATRASVVHKTGNFDGKTFEQVAREVMAPTKVPVKVIGTLDATPYARLQAEKGETIWNFLERIARPRGIILGSDKDGNLLLIDNHVGEVTSSLIEGWNILRCSAIIAVKDVYSEYIVSAQTPADSQQNGTAASEQEAAVGGSLGLYSPLLTPAEQPVWSIAEVAKRAANEAIWHEADIVKAQIVVQGWMRPGTGLLWTCGDDVIVHSPLAMLNMVMKIEQATFTQDNETGTLTTLDLVAPWLLKDQNEANVNTPGAPQPPGNAQPTGPAANPPAQTPDAPPSNTLPTG
jgi:prophage tail gpP-like protein